MLAFLIHGMGRDPLDMMLLGYRLWRGGLKPRYFGYYATFEGYAPCLQRLVRSIDRRAAGQPYILVGHSLGTVLSRAALPLLAAPPQACFFIAPPTAACAWALRMKERWLYRVLTREMGQKLADPAFMAALPVPVMPSIIFAGTKGPRWDWWPSGHAVNDGILTLEESRIGDVPLIELDALHSFIMNHPRVAEVIVHESRKF